MYKGRCQYEQKIHEFTWISCNLPVRVCSHWIWRKNTFIVETNYWLNGKLKWQNCAPNLLTIDISFRVGGEGRHPWSHSLGSSALCSIPCPQSNESCWTAGRPHPREGTALAFFIDLFHVFPYIELPRHLICGSLPIIKSYYKRKGKEYSLNNINGWKINSNIL